MVEEEQVVAPTATATSPVPSNHKRKLEDLEPEAPHPTESNPESNPEDGENADAAVSDEAENKRPRLDENDKPDTLANANGHQDEEADEPVKETEENLVTKDGEPDLSEAKADEQAYSEIEEPADSKEVPVKEEEAHQENAEEPSNENQQASTDQDAPPSEDKQPDSVDVDPHNEEFPYKQDASSDQKQPTSGAEMTTKKIDVPNNKVGVLIGKAGDTIRYLQYNSGAKIQITRDSDADPQYATRPVEIIGSLESIDKAEKLMSAVIAEADAGGSPALVARGLSPAQAIVGSEQIQIQVPNEKVGLIIGRGGETIKGLQTKSGARIQLIPQHLPEGDDSKERTVQVTGDKRQIEIAQELIKEVMSQIWLLPLPWGQHCFLDVA